MRGEKRNEVIQCRCVTAYHDRPPETWRKRKRKVASFREALFVIFYQVHKRVATVSTLGLEDTLAV
jgi:hypothetical protein